MKKRTIILITLILIVIGISLYFIFSGKDSPESEKDPLNCIGAGEVIQSPSGLGELLGKCCGGLTEIIDFPVPIKGEFNCDEIFPLGSDLLCSDCGNAICESWENKCNCPEDCE